MTIREQAFQRIQDDKVLHKKWVHAKTDAEREDMMLTVAYDLGYDLGYECAQRAFAAEY